MTEAEKKNYLQRMEDGEIRWMWHWEWRKPFSILLSEIELGQFTGRKTYIGIFYFFFGLLLGKARKLKRQKKQKRQRQANLPRATAQIKD